MENPVVGTRDRESFLKGIAGDNGSAMGDEDPAASQTSSASHTSGGHIEIPVLLVLSYSISPLLPDEM